MRGLGLVARLPVRLEPMEHRFCFLDCPPSLEVRLGQSYPGNRRVTTKRVENLFRPAIGRC